jgi:hypothetical protein
MRLHLGIVTATPALLYEAVEHAAQRAAQPFELTVFANVNRDIDVAALSGPKCPNVTVGGSDENVGCTLGMHHIWQSIEGTTQVADDDLIVYIHDDLNILEDGWDDRIRRLFEARPQAMLAGFGGARQLGAPHLYRVPYQLQDLARFNFASNMENAEVHGRRVTAEERSATLDSFTLILRGQFQRELGGWDWWPYPCHNFDNAVCCEAKRRSHEVWLIPVKVHHKGGMTSCGPIYQDWAKAKFGGDGKVHADSHDLLYDRYRDVLPIYV